MFIVLTFSEHHTWRAIITPESVPPPRSNHSAIIYGFFFSLLGIPFILFVLSRTRMYIFGGEGEHHKLNDTWYFDFGFPAFIIFMYFISIVFPINL